MSTESERQMRVLKLLCELGPMNTVALTRKCRFGLMETAGAASLLILRGLAERSIEGEFSATPEGLAFEASGAKFRSGPVRQRGLMKVSQDTLRQRAWTAMRLHLRFTIDDLVMLSARSGDRQPHAALQRYLSTLCKHGYVVRLPKRASRSAPTSNGAVVYRLLRNTGDRAPTVSRQGELIDRNEVAA